MIPAIATSLLAVAGFGLVLWLSRIATVARETLSTTMTGLSAMMDSDLDDDAKEVAVRRAGFRLILAGFSVFWRIALALGAAAAPIYLVDALGLVSADAVFALMLRLDYILIVSVAVIALVEVVRRLRPAKAEKVSGPNRYSATDRFFHTLAFSSPAVLKTVSSLEDRLVRKAETAPSAPPIFVTSLARGGTTALLNALHDVEGIATHTYRDMPFLTAPILWNRIAGGKRRNVERHQRAHGDGLEIDLDSPEAFEEVVWKMFWPEKYRGSSIPLWTADDRKVEADRFLDHHMAKVVRARMAARDDAPATARYCSKNNGNVARINYLKGAFPGCGIVVPVRRPESHAASLLRQHRNFLSLQSEDPFIRRYMRDIGHFEFGQILKPVAFRGFDPTRYDPTTADYWLDYWIHAFREILNQGANCHFVLQDDLRTAPQETMTVLCDALALPKGAAEFRTYFRSEADTYPVDSFDPALYEEAQEIYRALQTQAVGRGSEARSDAEAHAVGPAGP